MKLIEQARTPNPRRVKIFLAEKGITVPTEQIDINKGDHRLPDFVARNPMGQIPVLILDDGTAISESVAICRYFEETNPEPPLFGRDARDRAIVEMMNRRMELGLLNRIAQAFRHTHPAMAEMEVPQVKEWGEANRGRIGGMLELIDTTLAATPFIAGDHYTIADITTLVAVDFLRPLKYDRPMHLANLARWYQAVASRPSAKA
jgi:glutathione S-transferase